MHVLLILLLSWPQVLLPVRQVPDQMSQSAQHTVEPGDTWLALALRYDTSVAELQALSPRLNTTRNPAIGTTIPVPQVESDAQGAIWRGNDGGLLQTAVLSGTSGWSLALRSDVASPFEPELWRPILVPGEQPIIELPPGVRQLTLSPHIPVPGQALAAKLAVAMDMTDIGVQLDGRPFAVTHAAQKAVAVGGTGAFTTAGEHELSIQQGGGPVWRQPWSLATRDWIFQELNLTGEAAAIDQAAIDSERERLMTIWSRVSPEPQWDAPFQTPIGDYLEISADYGARRSYNGGPYRTYHEGTDFSAYRGTPVTAAAAGTVVLAETLPVRGGAVIIDHGLGIYTGYYHLSAVLVAAGQHLVAGDQVGEVGTTGFSTGNHLHWDLIVNGTWVDAIGWQQQDTACWLLEAFDKNCREPS